MTSWRNYSQKSRVAARIEYEERTHLTETMLGLGWHAVGWAPASGRPNQFAFGVDAKSWRTGLAKPCFLIMSKTGAGTAWSLRYWDGRYYPMTKPHRIIRETRFAFSNPVSCALLHKLFKLELSK